MNGKEPMSADELFTEVFNGGKIVGNAIGMLDGMAEERKRILALFEKSDSACSQWAIALIKGEN